MKFGDKLRQERIKAGLTQEELSLHMGVTCRTLQNYESGAVYPKKRELYTRLAEFFGTEVDYWLSETQRPPASDVQSLVDQISAAFMAGNMTEEALDALMRVLQNAYWEAKDKMKSMQYGRDEL